MLPAMRVPSAATNARTPPWLEPGWLERVGAWTRDRLRAAGVEPIGESHVVYTGPLAKVLRTPSNIGMYFTKCSVRHFADEARVTQALAIGTPAWVPNVIDIQPDESWLLMADFGSRPLGDEPQTA